IESELFGHERGAFTGSRDASVGLLRAAGEGTVFLDEVTEMPVTLQAKLLRVLEQRRVRPVGGLKEVHFGARVVAATNLDPVAAPHSLAAPRAMEYSEGDAFPALAEVESRHIRRALHLADGNKTSAAKLLGVSRHQLYIKLHRLGIED